MELASPGALIELGYGYRMSRCLHAAMELGVPDAIEADAPTAEVLGARLGCHVDSLRRLMMTLASGGVFAFRDGGFAHTAASLTLRADHPQTIAPFIRFTGAEYQWQAWSGLAAAIRSGDRAFETAHGCDIFEFYRKHPSDGRIFDQAMTAAGRSKIPAVVGAFDFTAFRTVADIGGGRGHLLRAILDSSPGRAGVLFDLPDVSGEAQSLSDGRIRFVGGDFFKDDMPAADAYLFMMILHDWDDEACVTMLQNLRRTMPSHAQVLVIETVISDEPGVAYSRLSDMTMLVLAEGRERTESEYAALFARAGFRLTQPPIPTESVMSILVAAPD